MWLDTGCMKMNCLSFVILASRFFCRLRMVLPREKGFSLGVSHKTGGKRSGKHVWHLPDAGWHIGAELCKSLASSALFPSACLAKEKKPENATRNTTYHAALCKDWFVYGGLSTRLAQRKELVQLGTDHVVMRQLSSYATGRFTLGLIILYNTCCITSHKIPKVKASKASEFDVAKLPLIA